MKILFLDFDGVLNSKLHFLMEHELPPVPGADTLSDADLFIMKRHVNVSNMWCLKYILTNVPNLKIVISSAWRLHYRLDQIADLFQYYKIDDSRMIGKTPKKFSSERMHEIHMWLDEQNEPKHDDAGNEIPQPKVEIDWVALDDHPIFMLEDPDKAREFLTDPWVGLSMHDAFKIIKHFDPTFKEPEMYI